MSIVSRVVVDVAVNTKESIASLDKLSKATKSYRDDTKVFKEISKEQGKSIDLYTQQMKLVDNYKAKVLELKKAREAELKVFKESVQKSYGKDVDTLTISDVETKKLAEHSKRLDEIDKLTKQYNKTLEESRKGSKEYKQAQESLNKIDEERLDIIKRSSLEADVAFSQVQARVHSFNVDISKHDNELNKLERSYENLKNSSNAFTESIKRQGNALKSSNQSQYAQSIQRADEQYKQGMQERSDAYNSIFNTANRVGNTLVGLTSATGVLGVAGVKAVNSYLDHNYQEIDVLRMAGDASPEQLEELKSTMDHIIRNNHETNEDIFALLAELIRFVGVDEYGDTLKNMAQNALNLSLAGDMTTSEAANAMASLNLITKRDPGDATLFHGLNQLQNEKGVDLGGVVKIIQSSMSRLLNAGWDEAGVATIAGMTERLFARGNDAAARGISELGEMIGLAQFDTSEVTKYIEFGKQYGVEITAKDINDKINKYENDKNDYLNHMRGTYGMPDPLDDNLFKAQAEAYQLQEDLMKALKVGSVSEMYTKVNDMGADEAFIELVRYLKTLTGPKTMKDGSVREVTLAEIAGERGYLSNNAITQEVLNNLFAFEHEFDGYKAEVEKGMEEGTSLTDEANVFRESDKAQFDLIKKEIQLLIVEIGESLAPAVLNVLKNLDPVKDFIIGIVDWIAELDPETIEKVLKGLLATNVAGWGFKGVGALGQTFFQMSEIGRMFGKVMGGNSKRGLRETRDLAKGEATLLKTVVDALIDDDVSKGLVPLGLDEYTALAKQHIKVKDGEIKVTKDVVDLLNKQSTSLTKVADVIDTVDDAGDVLSDVSSTVKNTTVSLAGTVSDLGADVATTTTSIGSKFTTFLASLSPLTKIALAVGAIAATGFAINKIGEFMQDRKDEERKWGKDNNIDKETKDTLEKVVEGNKEIMLRVNQSAMANVGMEFSEDELTKIQGRFDNYKESLATEIDKLQPLADKGGVVGESASKLIDELTKVSEDIGNVAGEIENIRADGGEASAAQVNYLSEINNKVGNILDKTLGGDGSIEGFLSNTSKLNSMNNKEKRAYVKDTLARFKEYDDEREAAIEQLNNLRINAAYDPEIDDWTDEQYNKAVAEVIKEWVDKMRQELPEVDYIEKNTWMGLLSSERSIIDEYNMKLTDPYNIDLSRDYSTRTVALTDKVESGDLFGQLEELTISIKEYVLTEGSKKEGNEVARNIFNENLLALKVDKDFKFEADESRFALEAIKQSMDELSASQVFDLVEDLSNDKTFSKFWNDATVQLDEYIRSVEDLSTLTDEEIKLHLVSNLDEMELGLMDMHNLWENRDFTEHMLGVALDGGSLGYALNTFEQAVDNTDSTIKIDADISNALDKVNRLNLLLIRSEKGTIGSRITSKTVLSGSLGRNYAQGTQNHPGGIAILGDGFEQELVYEPGKSPYLTQAYPHKRDLPRGSVVIPYSKIPTINSRPYSKTPLYNQGIGNTSSIIGDTNNNTTYEIHIAGVNANVREVESMIRKIQREDELNNRRKKESGGES